MQTLRHCCQTRLLSGRTDNGSFHPDAAADNISFSLHVCVFVTTLRHLLHSVLLTRYNVKTHRGLRRHAVHGVFVL